MLRCKNFRPQLCAAHRTHFRFDQEIPDCRHGRQADLVATRYIRAGQVMASRAEILIKIIAAGNRTAPVPRACRERAAEISSANMRTRRKRSRYPRLSRRSNDQRRAKKLPDRRATKRCARNNDARHILLRFQPVRNIRGNTKNLDPIEKTPVSCPRVV